MKKVRKNRKITFNTRFRAFNYGAGETYAVWNTPEGPKTAVLKNGEWEIIKEPTQKNEKRKKN